METWAPPVLEEGEADLYGLNRYPPITWHEILLSFEGRIPRSTFWRAYLSLAVVCNVLVFGLLLAAVMGDANDVIIMGIVFVLPAPFAIPAHAILTKRWHDINRSGWNTFWSLVPVLGTLYVLVMVGFVRGTSGRNEYGPGPVFR